MLLLLLLLLRLFRLLLLLDMLLLRLLLSLLLLLLLLELLLCLKEGCLRFLCTGGIRVRSCRSAWRVLRSLLTLGGCSSWSWTWFTNRAPDHGRQSRR